MPFSQRVLTTACIALLSLSVSTANAEDAKRDVAELSTPIVMLTPVVAKNAQELELNAEQQAALEDWLASSPAVREALEDRVIAQRGELRSMILTGADPQARAEKAAYIGQLESELLMMRSNCADHWRNVLSEEQFARVLELAGS
ncbi:MAG: hypothetical protein FMJ08_03330 [Halomonas sp.]|nr:hypothetical protein [Halomonas sp.]TVM07360.1 MAG: hypothetical protein FMJ08_03330 [Halomonas sp.]